LEWASQSGKTYRVEYRDDLSASTWTSLGTYPATGGTTTATDSTAGPTRRFYRVVQTN
jgi:hypothetical protein